MFNDSSRDLKVYLQCARHCWGTTPSHGQWGLIPSFLGSKSSKEKEAGFLAASPSETEHDFISFSDSALTTHLTSEIDISGYIVEHSLSSVIVLHF